jgi:hypothetical protein
MERTALYENDLTEERSATPIQREEAQHTLAMDQDVEDDEEDEDDVDDLEDDELDD